MDNEVSGLWWLVAIVASAVGAAMALYGIRQKASLPLVFGIAMSVIPMMASYGWAAAALFFAIGALFLLLRSYLSD